MFEFRAYKTGFSSTTKNPRIKTMKEKNYTFLGSRARRTQEKKNTIKCSISLPKL